MFSCLTGFMQTKHLSVLIHILTKGEVTGHCETGFSPPAKYFYWPFHGGASFVDHLCYFCLLFGMLSCTSVYWCLIMWSHAGKGLTYWLSFVMSNCEVVTFPLVSWVRCGAWLYRFLIFALFLFWTVLRKDEVSCSRTQHTLPLVSLELVTLHSQI